MRDWRNERLSFAIFTLPAAFWILVLFTLPLLIVWVYSFMLRGPQGQIVYEFSLSNYARSFEWLTSVRRLPAAEALDWGLVSEVVPDDRLASRAAEVAGELAAMPTLAIGRTKRLLDHADERGVSARVRADGAELLLGEAEAARAGPQPLLDLGDRLSEGEPALGRRLHQMEGEALGAPGADPGQAGELGHQPVDRRREDDRH